MKTVKEIVEDYLRENDFSGLYSECQPSCYCTLGNLFYCVNSHKCKCKPFVTSNYDRITTVSCSNCGGSELITSGACWTCKDCGETSGCG